MINIETTVGSSSKSVDRKMLDVLTGLLWSPSPMWEIALQTLGQIGTSAVPDMLIALQSKTLPLPVKEELVTVLSCQLFSARAITPVLIKLATENHELTTHILQAMAKLGDSDRDILDSLAAAATSENIENRNAAIAALKKIGSDQARDILGRTHLSKEEDEFLAGLQKEDPQKTAGALFENLPYTATATKAWLQALQEPNSNLRRAASQITNKDALLEWLTQMLYASGSKFEAAAKILGSFGAEATPYLVNGIKKSGNFQQQRTIATQLCKAGPEAAAKEALPALLRIVRHSRFDPLDGRVSILDALAKIAADDPGVINQLKAIAANDKDRWQKAAAAALEFIECDPSIHSAD